MKKTEPLNPEKYAEADSEDSQQIALFMWAALNIDKYPDLKFMFAVPNGMFTPYKQVAGKMRAMGMKRGVPDIMLPVKRGEWSGLFIELKRKKTEKQAAGKTSNEQNEWIGYLQNQGYGVAVCYGFEQSRDMVLQYLEYKEDKSKITKKDMEKFNAS